MESMYDDIIRFMKEYFPAYSEKGQVKETQHVMDKFYAPDLAFDEGVITSREHLFIDEQQKVAGALVKTQAIERASGKVLLEIKMNVLYSLKVDKNKDIKITSVKVFLESNPQKAARLMQVYGMKM